MSERDGGGRRLSRAVRRSIAAGAILLSATAGIGALHTSWGRPLLARLGGCPAARVTAAEVEGLRQRGMTGIRGDRPAPVRPALGFLLDRTTPADVRTWAARVGVICSAKKHGLMSLHCPNVPRSSLPITSSGVIEDLALTFDSKDRLISVDAFTRQLPPETATAAFSSSGARLAEALGPPTDHVNDDGIEATPVHSPAPLGTARRRFRFNDYVAIVSLTNLPSGLAVREQYLSGT